MTVLPHLWIPVADHGRLPGQYPLDTDYDYVESNKRNDVTPFDIGDRGAFARREKYPRSVD